jgi:hypothetical protein
VRSRRLVRVVRVIVVTARVATEEATSSAERNFYCLDLRGLFNFLFRSGTVTAG